MAGKISGVALAAAGTGVVFAYAAIRGKSVTASLQALVQGKSVASLPQANPVTDTTAQLAGSPGPGTPGSSPGSSSSSSSSTPVASGGSNQAILQATAAKRGWTGAQWTALYNVEMAEAGFSTTARNPASGALGMAQALGHGTSGTAGSLGNEYGGFGLTNAQAQAANSGDAAAQALWMCNYIAATYGTPEAAWAHEQAYHWY